MTTEEIKQVAIVYDRELKRHPVSSEALREDLVKFGQIINDHWQEKTRWIPVEERLPKYGVDVLVKRPNKYSGNVDILLSRLHQAKKEGQEYGRGDGIGSYPKTFKDYWSLPSIALLGDITHWKEIEL